MKEKLYYLILLRTFHTSLSLPLCIDGQNLCVQCHNKLDLCAQSENDIFSR